MARPERRGRDVSRVCRSRTGRVRLAFVGFVTATVVVEVRPARSAASRTGEPRPVGRPAYVSGGFVGDAGRLARAAMRLDRSP